MKLKAFVHGSEGHLTTLSEIKRVHDWTQTKEFFGLFAYATHSGAAAFELKVGPEFWNNVASRWLFGIDYGRTQPTALRRVIELSNTEVRVFDGAWLVEKDGFLPRRDFHAKASFCSNESLQRHGLVVGSGNFSANGLTKSIEAGASLQATNESEYTKTIHKSFLRSEELWNQATPATEVLSLYEEKWSRSTFRAPVSPEPEQSLPDFSSNQFWIEAGYVTKNRGPERPGNQIDFPRGMCRYFGFSSSENIARNTVIGSVTFDPPSGGLVDRNLRLGNNLMEKISLPIPETHGFDLYDGKVLVFERGNGKFKMWALEEDDFTTAFGDRVSGVRTMNSGRRYGHIVNQN